MGGFLWAAAVLVAVTLLLLLRPWRRAPKAGATAREINAGVYRDQLLELDRDRTAGTLSAADHEQARAELQRRLLDDASVGEAVAPVQSMRVTGWLLALTLPLAAAGLYAWLGTPLALDPRAAEVATQDKVDKMVATLAARMEKNPNDTKGWVVLARSYRAMGRLPQAESAYAHIGDAINGNATLLAEYADVLATRSQGHFEGKPAELVARALQLEPNNGLAMSLAAAAAYNRNDLAQAVAYWERLQTMVAPESDEARWLAQTLAQTRAQMGAASGAAATTTIARADSAAAAGGKSITGRVSLSAALKGQVQPTDTVFVFARAAQGPRMPLAVQRAHVSDLPLDFKLDDSMAMNPQFKLSSVADVRIEARISKTGSATPGPGDLIGVGPTVQPGASKVELQIDQVRP